MGRPLILYVEDDELWHELMSEFSRKSVFFDQCELVIKKTIPLARSFYESQASNVVLLIADANIPEFEATSSHLPSGVCFAKYVHAHNKDLPIVLVSGSVDTIRPATDPEDEMYVSEKVICVDKLEFGLNINAYIGQIFPSRILRPLQQQKFRHHRT